MDANKVAGVVWRLVHGVYSSVAEARWFWPSLTAEEWGEVERLYAEHVRATDAAPIPAGGDHL